IPLIRSTEECGGADLRRKDRRQDRPPRDAPVPDSETFHRSVAPALIEADANYTDEIRENHPAIDKPGHNKASVIHDAMRSATSKREGVDKPQCCSLFFYMILMLFT